VSDPSKAEREIGWKARYLEPEGIIATAWEWHRQHPDGYEDDDADEHDEDNEA
jgi:UDP-glucose 4-epimerase